MRSRYGVAIHEACAWCSNTDRQISKVGMMAPKDVRPLLSAMAADSIISLQEVPKSADRNPARTFFLW